VSTPSPLPANPAPTQVAAPAPARFAERRADEALDRIADLVSMRRTARGRVITLASDDLFAPGQWTLTVDPEVGLADIASALSEQGARLILVEAHTDSLGDARDDTAISQRRADAVRSYLVAHGANATRVRATGLGPRDPVADNGNADGRVANRRVEIVIEPAGEDRARGDRR
jgi:outer membrane protein OmpA-like peptidoglycan-associated protein